MVLMIVILNTMVLMIVILNTDGVDDSYIEY